MSGACIPPEQDYGKRDGYTGKRARMVATHLQRRKKKEKKERKRNSTDKRIVMGVDAGDIFFYVILRIS